MLITTATAAKILRTSEATVRALERRGELVIFHFWADLTLMPPAHRS